MTKQELLELPIKNIKGGWVVKTTNGDRLCVEILGTDGIIYGDIFLPEKESLDSK
jgi:hypothetical protein